MNEFYYNFIVFKMWKRVFCLRFIYYQKSLALSFSVLRVTQMHENGLMKIWEQNHWPDRCVSSSGTVVNEAKPITWLDVQLAFGSLGTGMVIGCLVLLVENCVSRMKRQNVLGNHQHTASDRNKSYIEEAVDETTPSFDS